MLRVHLFMFLSRTVNTPTKYSVNLLNSKIFKQQSTMIWYVRLPSFFISSLGISLAWQYAFLCHCSLCKILKQQHLIDSLFFCCTPDRMKMSDRTSVNGFVCTTSSLPTEGLVRPLQVEDGITIWEKKQNNLALRRKYLGNFPLQKQNAIINAIMTFFLLNHAKT